jgi:hypothetical protein
MRNGLAPWASWMPVEQTADGVRMRLPGKLDPNHLDGIGPLWLLAHLRVTSVGGPGVVDFDQAEITIRLRAHNVDLKGARLLWWLTRQLPKEDTSPEFPWQETNWALTCCDLSKQLGEDWTTVTTRIDDDPSRWTYAGNNLIQQGIWGFRYVYYPLGKLLKDNYGSLHLAIVGSNAADRPTGTIEISQITIQTKEPARPLTLREVLPLVDQGRWDEARWHFKQLLPSDDPQLNYQYGRLLAEGLGGDPDYDEAVACLQKAASLPEARLELAKLYFYGLGVLRDQAKAVQLLASEQVVVEPEARYLLGLAFSYGVGVQKDQQAAISNFQYAAERGDPHAMLELARLLIQSDPAKAYYWYKRSRQRITRESDGAEAEMLDWNIHRLRGSLPFYARWYEDLELSHFNPFH